MDTRRASVRRPRVVAAVCARWAVLLAVALPVVGFGQGEARAGGFSNLDFGIRRMGMFAVTARPDDGTAVFHNPAGLTLTPGTQFYHSQSWFVADLGFQMYDSQGNLQPDKEITPDWSVGVIPFLGISTDFGLEDLRVAFAVYAPNAYGAALPEDKPTRYHANDALFVAARATVAASYDITDKFTVGASVSLIGVYLTASRIMNGKVLIDPDERFKPVSETAPDDIDMQLDGYDFTAGFDIGLLFRPTDTLYLGMSFSSGSPIELEGDVSLKYATGEKQKITHSTKMVIPMALRAGFNWEFAEDFQLGMDVYWWYYQVFQIQRSKLSEPVLGMEEFADPKNYGNSWNWCIGMMYTIMPGLEVMVGYQEDYTPIPTQTFTLDNPSRDQRGISMGLRWQINEDVRVGFAYARNWFELPDVQDSLSLPPSNMKGHGGNNEFGLEVMWRLL